MSQLQGNIKNMDEEWMTVAEFAKSKNISPQVVYNNIAKGKYKKQDVIKTKIEKTVFRIKPDAEPTENLNEVHYG